MPKKSDFYNVPRFLQNDILYAFISHLWKEQHEHQDYIRFMRMRMSTVPHAARPRRCCCYHHERRMDTDAHISLCVNCNS